MAGSASNYLSKKLLDHVLGATSYSAPGTVYIALGNGTPTDTTFPEIGTGTWSNYARVSVTNNTSNWENATGGDVGTKANKVSFSFGSATCSGSQVVNCFAIYDSTGATNILYYGMLGTSKTVQNGDTVSFGAGSIIIILD